MDLKVIYPLLWFTRMRLFLLMYYVKNLELAFVILTTFATRIQLLPQGFLSSSLPLPLLLSVCPFDLAIYVYWCAPGIQR